MKTWHRWASGALFVLPLTAALFAVLALQGTARVPPRDDVALADVSHAMAVARAHDPRRARIGSVTAAAVTERDLELLLNHAARRPLGVRVRVTLEPGQALIEASAERPGHALPGLGRWLNLEARLQESPGLPTLDSLRLGRLPLPAWLAAPLLRALAAANEHQADLELVTDVVQRVKFERDRLTVVYVWRDDTSRRVLAALTPDDQQQRLRAYSDRLVALTGQPDTGWTIALPRLLGPIFALARERSRVGDAAGESRAAILTLALYVTGRHVGAVVPAARAWPRPRLLRVTLNGRDDFPQHFLVSAALVIEGTTPLAQVIGVYKEVADSQGGSGFSFNDLAANRAGQRFGEAARADPGGLQARLAGGVDDRSLMPDVADLPEFLSAADFARRYGGVGAPDYERVLADIERRVAALPLYR